jgi:hypothetical protein
MSLYQLQKLIYTLNRDETAQSFYRVDADQFLSGFSLTHEERDAIARRDIGLLYVLGVNGQLLMHFAAFIGMEWSDYLQRMRDGVALHGPVRAGIYAMTSQQDEKVAGL